MHRTQTNLIPLPNQLTYGDGSLPFNGKLQWITDSHDTQLHELLQRISRYPEFSMTGNGNQPVRVEIRCSCLKVADESYLLEINNAGILLQADSLAGIFYGVQTLRQIIHFYSGELPFLKIQDEPRFEWRGLMVDVARHFFPIQDLKVLLEQLASFKFNRMHLHLTDDQGWRIEIPSWPDLTRIGSTGAVNGDRGGFYTRAELEDLIRYANERCITIVPEVDMPGHTQAALASYPVLNKGGKPTEMYTGIEVGFSSLDPDMEITYSFIDDVIAEIASVFPSPWIHIGGDEAAATLPDDYLRFIRRVEQIVQKHKKTMIGWEEVGKTSPAQDTILQSWKVEEKTPPPAANQVILSPANRVYLDMKYDETSPLGLQWAGIVPLEKSYRWDPAAEIPGTGEDVILGVEAALWSETLTNRSEQEWMLYPRLLAVAETAWTAQHLRDWNDFHQRLLQSQNWLTHLGIQPGPIPS